VSHGKALRQNLPSSKFMDDMLANWFNSLSSADYFLESTNENFSSILWKENLRLFKIILQKNVSWYMYVGYNKSVLVWGMADRRQAISQSNDDPDLCCMHAACEEKELKYKEKVIYIIWSSVHNFVSGLHECWDKATGWSESTDWMCMCCMFVIQAWD